jgi:hypothetical protein
VKRQNVGTSTLSSTDLSLQTSPNKNRHPEPAFLAGEGSAIRSSLHSNPTVGTLSIRTTEFQSGAEIG